MGGVGARECKMLAFPVFSRSVIPANSVGRTEVVEINVPIFCGGVLVKPGDIVVGDADGVVVIPREKLGGCGESLKNR